MVSGTHSERAIHASTLLGYAVAISALGTIGVIALSQLQWTRLDDNGVLTLSNTATFWGVSMASMAGYVVADTSDTSNCSQDVYPHSGPKYWLFCVATHIVLLPCFAGVVFATIVDPDGLPLRYWGFESFLAFAYVGCAGGISEVGRTLWFKHDQQRLATHHMEQHQEEDAPSAPPAINNECTTAGKSRTALLVQYIPFFAGILICLFYPFYVIPVFFAGGVGTRMLICLLVHPIVLESAEVIGRASSSSLAAKKLSQGEWTMEQAERYVVEGSLVSYSTKQIMSMFRRCMLLNMGSQDATTIAVVAASIEEVLSRGFLVEIDELARRISGHKKLEGQELHLQKLVWMCDTNLSAIAELCAILVSSFGQVIFERQKLIFALGCEATVALDVPSVFVQLMAELALELLVDFTAMFAEEESGIPVTEYFKKTKLPCVFSFHIALLTVSFSNTLYSFMRVPNVFTCDSAYVCDCVEQPQYQNWTDKACAAANNMTSSAHHHNQTTSDFVPAEEDIFTNVDPLAFVLVIVTGLAILTLVILSVLFSRYRRKKGTVAALEIEKRELGGKLAEAQHSLEEAGEILKIALKDTKELSHLESYKLKHTDLAIGEAIGTVHIGVLHGVRQAAIKTMRSTRISKESIEKFMGEVQIMAALRHPNVVLLLGAVWEDGPDKLCIVLEYCERGSLKSLLMGNQANFSWHSVYHLIASGLAQCLRYFHHEQSGDPLIHRDVKPDNTLLTSSYSAKLCDFGESTRFDIRAARLRSSATSNEDEGTYGVALTMTMVGTPMHVYCAPEVLGGLAYNTKADVYSFGVTLCELVCHQDCDHVKKEFAVINLLEKLKGQRPAPTPLVHQDQPRLWELVQECWAKDMEDRPDMIEVVERLEVIRSENLGVEGAKDTNECGASIVQEFDDFDIEAFLEVPSAEKQAVDTLAEQLYLTFKSRHVPSCFSSGFAHSFGKVALHRTLRTVGFDVEEALRKCILRFDLRITHEFDQLAEEITREEYRLNELPGVAEAHSATFEYNDWLCTDRFGDIITYARLGNTNPLEFVQKISLSVFAKTEFYRSEALSMILDMLSRRSKQIISRATVLNCKGLRIAHRRMFPYMKEWAGGPSKKSTATRASVTIFVGLSSLTHGMIGIISRNAANERQRKKLIYTTADAFVSDTFQARFTKESIPADIGGTKVSGTDGNCCVGEVIPRITDHHSIWERWETSTRNAEPITKSKQHRIELSHGLPQVAGEEESKPDFDTILAELEILQGSKAQLERRIAELEAANTEEILRLNAEIDRLREEKMAFRSESDDTGILGGMFIYHPDKQGSLLGEGAFGCVRRVRNPTDGQIYAVKELRCLTTDDAGTMVDGEAMGTLLAEVRKLGIVRSEFIVNYLTSSVVDSTFYIVMELIDGVEFRDALVARQATGQPFTEEQLASWFVKLATGLAHLHDDCKLVHQDLHNGNIMLTGLCLDDTSKFASIKDDEALLHQTSVKILDLGLSSFKTEYTHSSTARSMRTLRMQTMTQTMAATRKGSFVEIEADAVAGFKAIRAPEMWRPEGGGAAVVRFNAKADVWALALLLCEAVLLNPIEEWFPGDRAKMQSFGRDRALQEAKIVETTERSPRLGAVVGRLLNPNPNERPSARQCAEDLHGIY